MKSIKRILVIFVLSGVNSTKSFAGPPFFLCSVLFEKVGQNHLEHQAFLSTRKLESQLSSLGDKFYPALDSRTVKVLRDLPPQRKVWVKIDGVSPSKNKEELMSAEDVVKFYETHPTATFKVTRIPRTKDLNEFRIQASKFEGAWHEKSMNPEYAEFISDRMVELESGEFVRFSGSIEQFAELSNDPSVRRIFEKEPPSWLRYFTELPVASRSGAFDTATLYSKIPKKFIYNSRDAGSDISNMVVYHGTLNTFENAVKMGPKNVGSGFGGRGLYVAQESDKGVAEFFAVYAKQNAKSRLSEVAQFADATIDNAKPVLMRGRVNPNRNLRVGKFKVHRDAPIPDLENGILPARWAQDPNLSKMMEDYFDIVEITEMKTSGLAVDADRVLVFHESAGRDAIIWEPTSTPVKN